MNSITISGRLAKEPELKTLNNGVTKLTTRIAVTRSDKNKTTDFFSVQAWNKTADFISKYFKKGDPIEIVGRLQVDNYERQDGTKASEVYIYIIEAGFTISKKAEASAEPPRMRDSLVEKLLTADPDAEPDLYAGDSLPFQI